MVITTGRPATLSPRGMVTCPHALASQAGVDALRAGGSAVDAAIATSAALTCSPVEARESISRASGTSAI